jgi:hypothetical protein
MIGLAPHRLRDERLRGRITASSIVGRRVRCLRQDLLDYRAAPRQRLSSPSPGPTPTAARPARAGTPPTTKRVRA